MAITHVFGQTVDYQPLKNGDKVPDFLFTIFSNGVLEKTKLSDFRGKYLVLDTWSTGCGDCVAGMPHMLNIQQQYRDSVKILYVTPHTPAELKEFYLQQRKLGNTKLTEAFKAMSFIISDSIFRKLFVYNGYGSCMWVNKEGILVSHNRGGDNINNKSLDAWMNTGGIDLLERNIIDFNDFSSRSQFSWVKKRMGFNAHFLNFSILASFDPNSTVGSIKEKDSVTGNKCGITAINFSIPQLYRRAYSDYSPIYDTTSIGISDLLIISESPKYQYFKPDTSTIEEWMKKSTYCYVLKTNDTSEVSQNREMAINLDKYLKIHSSFQKRKVKVWVLKELPNGVIKTKGGESKWIFSNGNTKVSENNISASELMTNIYNRFSRNEGHDTPVFNEIKYTGNLDFSFEFNKNKISLASLNKQLAKTGVYIEEQVRELNVLVLEEVRDSN